MCVGKEFRALPLRHPEVQTNTRRRVFGLVVAAAPLVLVVASLLGGVSAHRLWSVPGMVVELLAMAVGGLNFYLSVLRPVLHARWAGSLEGYRRVSGFPVVGTVLVVAGTLAGFGAIIPAAVGLGALIIDIGGFPWFLVATWSDSGLWDTTRGAPVPWPEVTLTAGRIPKIPATPPERELGQDPPNRRS